MHLREFEVCPGKKRDVEVRDFCFVYFVLTLYIRNDN
jgi:hypothetical protein